MRADGKRSRSGLIDWSTALRRAFFKLPERFAMLGCEGSHDFVDARFKLGDLERLLKKREWGGVLAHRLIRLDAPPLCIHRDLCAVRTAMQTGGNKARRLTY